MNTMNVLKSTRTDPSCTDGNVVRKIGAFPVGTQVWLELEGESYCVDIVSHVEDTDVTICKVFRKGNEVLKGVGVVLVNQSALAEVDMGG